MAVDQLAADAVAMSSRLRQKAGGADASTADVVRAAGQAAGAAAAQLALEQGQEAGSAPAAASKAAAVLLEAAGVVVPHAQLQDLPPDEQSTAGPSGQHSSHSSSRQEVPAAGQSPSVQQHEREQQKPGVAHASTASRVAAELSSMQVLLVLPFAEVLCFADVLDSSSANMSSTSSGHR